MAELDLSCPVCREIFRDPVVLLCSHSFCRRCLSTWWADRDVHRCPVCMETSFLDRPPSNLVLKNLCEAFLQRRQRRAAERLCGLHGERLQLFCVDHQELVCLVCSKSRAHDEHRVRPADEAAADYREGLRRSLEPLRDKLQLLERGRTTLEAAERHVQVQAQSSEAQIRETFRKLRSFLTEEEEARIDALREEEQLKSRLTKEKMEALSRETDALSLTIRDAEEQLRAGDVAFLLGYKDAVDRVLRCPLLDAPQLHSGALMDQAQHVGNLSFHIWQKMKDLVSFSPVVLDPNTAHPELVLAEDLTAVGGGGGGEQELPENPERFQHHGIVLGRQGLSAGTHSWSVEVGDDPSWDIGVVEESIPRKGEIQSGCWEIGLSHGEYAAVAPPRPDQALRLRRKPQRIRVLLDWDAGTLSFLDHDTGVHLHSFRHRFTAQLFPFIFTKSARPARILPLAVSVAAGGPADPPPYCCDPKELLPDVDLY